MPLEKYLLNLAGEYRVASEPFKRGIFATITYGNRKGADIYAIGPDRRLAVIEVKASNSGRFVTGFYQKYRDELSDHPDFWVLYQLKALPNETFDEKFFVLSHAEMAEAQAVVNNSTALTYQERVAGVAKGVDNVSESIIFEHEDNWAKISEFLATPVAHPPIAK